MNKWKKVKLKDYIEQIRGVSYKPEDATDVPTEGYYPILRANNIKDNALIFDDFVYAKENKIKKEQMIQKGDIIVCASSGSKELVGKAAQAKKDLQMSFGAFCKGVRAKNILPEYLGNYFKSLIYRKTISRLSAGANINNIKSEHLDNLEIPLPTMEEQKKIAARLDAVSDLLAKQKQLLSEQDNLIQSTFYDMFGTPFKNEKGFPYLQIKDLVSDVQYGTSQKADYTGKMPILRMNNITYSGEMDYTDLKYIDLEEETNKYILKKGDVLFNRTNSRELVGKTGLFNLDKLMVYAGYLIRVRLKGICLPIFLTKYMNTPQLKAFLKEKCKGIVGQANINAKELQAIPIFLPPLELQQKFAAVAEQIESEKSKIKSAIAETQTLFNSMMSEYFEE